MARALSDRSFQTLETNGIRLRTVVEGDGPLLILLHGFPQSWYLWRHQIDPLVAAGWKVAAPDQRGYGFSDRPPAVSDYGIVDLTADIDGLASALGHDDYALMIHDWGAIVGWHVALRYAERVRAVVGLSVPYVRDHRWPAMCTQAHWGERFFYWSYFAKEGAAEAEFEADLRSTLLRFYVSAAGDRPRGPGRQPHTAGMLDTLPPAPAELPPWLTEADLDYYVSQYEASGFRGPINYYRNIPRLLELTPELEGVKVRPPTTFLIGERDNVRRFIPLEGMEQRFEDLRGIEEVPRAGHWLPLEASDLVTQRAVEFLAQFR
ncbi:MAG: alpha/beta fold hydrolase [Acidimicrobiales bacterium]